MLTSVVAVSGGALLALFYFTEGDLGTYSELALGSVRGEQAARFALPPDEVIISSRRGGGGRSADVAILTEAPTRLQRVVRVVRENEALVFEQAVSTDFRSIRWDEARERFVVGTSGGREDVHLLPSEAGYTLIPAR